MLQLLSSCASVDIIDHEFCGDKGSLGAKCFHTLTAETRDVPKDEWDNERIAQICEKAEVWADWKKVLEEQCSFYGNCNYPKTKQILHFLNRVDRVSKEAKDAKLKGLIK